MTAGIAEPSATPVPAIIVILIATARAIALIIVIVAATTGLTPMTFVPAPAGCFGMAL
jgi:hypothetical protein